MAVNSRFGRKQKEPASVYDGQDADVDPALTTLDLLRALGWLIRHDVPWPGKSLAKIEHLLVGPPGVFVVFEDRDTAEVDPADPSAWQADLERALAAATDVAAALPGVPVTPVLSFRQPEPFTAVSGSVFLCTLTNIVEVLSRAPERINEVILRAVRLEVNAGLHLPTEESGGVLPRYNVLPAPPEDEESPEAAASTSDERQPVEAPDEAAVDSPEEPLAEPAPEAAADEWVAAEHDEAERLEAERAAAQQAEEDRLQADQQRLAAEEVARQEQQRQAEAEAATAAAAAEAAQRQAEADARAAAAREEQAEQERLAAEQAEAARLEDERAAAERDEAARVAAQEQAQAAAAEQAARDQVAREEAARAAEAARQEAARQEAARAEQAARDHAARQQSEEAARQQQLEVEAARAQKAVEAARERKARLTATAAAVPAPEPEPEPVEAPPAAPAEVDREAPAREPGREWALPSAPRLVAAVMVGILAIGVMLFNEPIKELFTERAPARFGEQVNLASNDEHPQLRIRAGIPARVPGQRVAIQLTVGNPADEAWMLDLSRIELVDSDGDVHQAKAGGRIGRGPVYGARTPVAPGSVAKSFLLFDLSRDDGVSELRLELGDDDTVVWFNRKP